MYAIFTFNNTNFLKKEIAIVDLQITNELMLHDGKNLLLSFCLIRRTDSFPLCPQIMKKVGCTYRMCGLSVQTPLFVHIASCLCES